MRYFVTGATGFIGGKVARMLAEAGHEVVALVRQPEKARGLAEAGITLHAGDITDKNSMRAGMEGADGVFHIAGWYRVGVRDTAAARAINIDGTRHVLELMKELNIPRGVYTSTLAINSDTGGRVVDESYHYDGPHLSVYDQTKWAAHRQVAGPMIEAGLPLVIVMPGLVYGPGDASAIHETFVQYLSGRLPLVPQKTAYAWGYIDDIAGAHLLAMEKGRVGESYIIAGPVHTLVEALALAEKITGVPAPRLHAPPALLRGLSALVGLVERAVTVPEQYSAEYLRVAAGVTYIGSNAKAKREWGYDPRPLENGLRETLRYEMAQLEIRPR